MKVNINELNGVIVKDNDTYILEDNNTLEHLTLSKTVLKPAQFTRGHSHEVQEEVYFFTKGKGTMVVDKEEWTVVPGDIVIIPKNKFHKVLNQSDEEVCEFVCVFEKYDRSTDTAKY